MPRHSLKILRQSLSAQLEKEEPNFDEILRLANETGRADPNFVRFSTDAAIISRLGRQLMSKQETALAELVKNAYDADARKCTVELIDVGGHAELLVGADELVNVLLGFADRGTG